jgi:hypothetical protein
LTFFTTDLEKTLKQLHFQIRKRVTITIRSGSGGGGNSSNNGKNNNYSSTGQTVGKQLGSTTKLLINPSKN